MQNKHKQKQIKDGDAQFLYYTNTPQRYHQTQFNKKNNTNAALRTKQSTDSQAQ